MSKYKTFVTSSHGGLILYFCGTQEELRELDGETFPTGTILHITESDTEHTKILNIINGQESIDYNNIPYSETVKPAATTKDTGEPNNRIDKLEERITKIEQALNMTHHKDIRHQR